MQVCCDGGQTVVIHFSNRPWELPLLWLSGASRCLLHRGVPFVLVLRLSPSAFAVVLFHVSPYVSEVILSPKSHRNAPHLLVDRGLDLPGAHPSVECIAADLQLFGCLGGRVRSHGTNNTPLYCNVNRKMQESD